MQWYELLAERIILYAVLDYQNACEKIERNKTQKDKDGKTPFEVKEECLRFFRSRWYEHLTSVDADYLISRANTQKAIKGQ